MEGRRRAGSFAPNRKSHGAPAFETASAKCAPGKTPLRITRPLSGFNGGCNFFASSPNAPCGAPSGKLQKWAFFPKKIFDFPLEPCDAAHRGGLLPGGFEGRSFSARSRKRMRRSEVRAPRQSLFPGARRARLESSVHERYYAVGYVEYPVVVRDQNHGDA